MKPSGRAWKPMRFRPSSRKSRHPIPTRPGLWGNASWRASMLCASKIQMRSSPALFTRATSISGVFNCSAPANWKKPPTVLRWRKNSIRTISLRKSTSTSTRTCVPVAPRRLTRPKSRETNSASITTGMRSSTPAGRLTSRASVSQTASCWQETTDIFARPSRRSTAFVNSIRIICPRGFCLGADLSLFPPARPRARSAP